MQEADSGMPQDYQATPPAPGEDSTRQGAHTSYIAQPTMLTPPRERSQAQRWLYFLGISQLQGIPVTWKDTLTIADVFTVFPRAIASWDS